MQTAPTDHSASEEAAKIVAAAQGEAEQQTVRAREALREELCVEISIGLFRYLGYVVQDRGDLTVGHGHRRGARTFNDFFDDGWLFVFKAWPVRWRTAA